MPTHFLILTAKNLPNGICVALAMYVFVEMCRVGQICDHACTSWSHLMKWYFNMFLLQHIHICTVHKFMVKTVTIIICIMCVRRINKGNSYFFAVSYIHILIMVEILPTSLHIHTCTHCVVICMQWTYTSTRSYSNSLKLNIWQFKINKRNSMTELRTCLLSILYYRGVLIIKVSWLSTQGPNYF